MDFDSEELSIFLHVVEGVRLDLKEENIVLVASLSGNKLETEPVQIGIDDVTGFNSNLIWETDKRSIKRMKTENLPIKLECFTTHFQEEQEIRTLVGYILLPLRGVSTALSKKAAYCKPHWYKLIGLNVEWKQKRPELLLFLTITDKMGKEILLSSKTKTMEPSQPEKKTKPIEPHEMLKTQHGIHVALLQEEGLLQVGNAELDCDIFIVKLMFRVARNLEQVQ